MRRCRRISAGIALLGPTWSLIDEAAPPIPEALVQTGGGGTVLADGKQVLLPSTRSKVPRCHS